MNKLIITILVTLVTINASANVLCALSKEIPGKQGQPGQILFQGNLDESTNPTIAVKADGTSTNITEKYPNGATTIEQVAQFKQDVDKTTFFSLSKAGSNLTMTLGSVDFTVAQQGTIDVIVNGAATPYLMTALPSKGLVLSCALAASK